MELEREVRRQGSRRRWENGSGVGSRIRNPLADAAQSGARKWLGFSQDQSQLMQIVLRESDRLNRIVSDFLTMLGARSTLGIDLSGVLGDNYCCEAARSFGRITL
jgi:hypothetical protein